MTPDKKHAPSLSQQAADEAVKIEDAKLASIMTPGTYSLLPYQIDALRRARRRLVSDAKIIATLTKERDAAIATERARIVARIRKVAARYANGSSNQQCLLVQAQSIEEGNP